MRHVRGGRRVPYRGIFLLVPLLQRHRKKKVVALMYSYVLGLTGRILLNSLRGVNLVLLFVVGMAWMFTPDPAPDERMFLWILSSVIVGTVLASAFMREWEREGTED